MNFFITAETYTSVSEKMRLAIIQIEPQINLLVKEKDYGEGISFWGHICIANPKNVYDEGFFKEIRRYNKENTEIDFRLRIDFKKVLSGNQNQIIELICHSILQGIDIAENELKIPKFNFIEFRNDLTKLFKKERWI